MEIEVSIPEVKQTLKQKIMIIYDISNVDILLWLKKFEEICEFNNWTNKKSNLSFTI